MQSALNEIKILLDLEISCLRQLIDTVGRERDALLQARHEDLLSIGEEKLRLADQMQQLQQKRRLLMSQVTGADQQPTKLIELVPHLPPAERTPFRQALNRVSELARRLAKMNQVNRDFVHEALDTVEHMLDVLTGRRDLNGYSPRGPASRPSRPRMLVREV